MGILLKLGRTIGIGICIARRFERVLIGLGLSGKGGQERYGNLFGLGLGARARLLLHLLLHRFDLLARLREPGAQESDAVAFDAGFARRFDGRRCFIQPLLQERILRTRKQPFVDFGESGTGVGICGIARLQSRIKLQCIVAGRLGELVRRERGRGASQQG